MKKLETAAAEADKRYGAAAAKLSAARQKSAEKLNKAVNAELAPLKLERAKFSTQIDSDSASPGPQGFDRVEFWVQTNPGTRPGPLMKVASGGELARFLLALKVVLSDRGSAPTLVFDEIDTGVGGAVADAIGARLARLASKVQVMAVTHAPQVAARADQHLLISKDALDKGKRVATRVNALAADHRREEIARMLAGAEITSRGAGGGGTAAERRGGVISPCPGRDAAFFMPLRRTGTPVAVKKAGPRLCSAPLREELRAALRPGNGIAVHCLRHARACPGHPRL